MKERKNNNVSSSIEQKKSPFLSFARILKALVVSIAVSVAIFVICNGSSNDLRQLMPSLSMTSCFRGFDFACPRNELVNVELIKLLKLASTKEKTVVLVTLNDAWAAPNSILDVFLKSLTIGNNTSQLKNHMLFIALEEKAYDRCKTLVPYCYFLKTKQSSEVAGQADFLTPHYLDLIWQRLAFLEAILSLGYNFLNTDADIMWFRDPFPHLESDADIQVSCDKFNGRPFDLNNQLNVGFMYVKSNIKTIKLYKYWLSSRHLYPKLHEQDVFHTIRKGPFLQEIGLKMRFLDTDHFSGFCRTSRDFSQVCTMHANCCVGLDKKVADLNTALLNWKRYIDFSSNKTSYNETMSGPLRWTVPKVCHM